MKSFGTLNLVFALFLLSGASAFAKGKFGPEWTVTNKPIVEASRDGHWQIENRHLEKASKLWKAEIKARCADCNIWDGHGRAFTVNAGTRFWFKVGEDPYVFEITGSPMDVEELEKHKAELQSLVFDAAKAAGLEPHWRVGGGHVHLDLETHFKGDALLFRNFVVDLMNRPELYMGALSLDYLNAPPLAIQKPEQRDELQRVLKEYDALPKSERTIERLKTMINMHVYTTSFINTGGYSGQKYQPVNLKRDKTVEIRGSRPQQSIDHHLLIAKLYEARIEKLKKVKKPIEYVRKDYDKLVSYTTTRDMEKYKTKLDPEIVLNAFKDFVKAAGLDWESYRHLPTEELKKELAKKRTGPKGVCKDIFVRAG